MDTRIKARSLLTRTGHHSVYILACIEVIYMCYYCHTQRQAWLHKPRLWHHCLDTNYIFRPNCSNIDRPLNLFSFHAHAYIYKSKLSIISASEMHYLKCTFMNILCSQFSYFNSICSDCMHCLDRDNYIPILCEIYIIWNIAWQAHLHKIVTEANLHLHGKFAFLWN